MSNHHSETLGADGRALAARGYGDNRHPWGQRHDRIADSFDAGAITPMTLEKTGDLASEPEVEISASQKMLSAVSGSLLTSLLGNVELLCSFLALT